MPVLLTVEIELAARYLAMCSAAKKYIIVHSEKDLEDKWDVMTDDDFAADDPADPFWHVKSWRKKLVEEDAYAMGVIRAYCPFLLKETK